MGDSSHVKLWHYKLLIILLYNEEIPGVVRSGDHVTMDILQLSRYLGQRTYRIRSCLGNLESQGTVYDLKMAEHAAEFRLLTPAGYSLDGKVII